MTAAILQVLGRVGLAVAANTVQKRLVRDGAAVGRLWLATHAWMLPAAILLAALRGPPPWSATFWRDAVLAGVLDALGNLAMVAALRATDLSVFGPLNALRPLLALAFGWVFLAERPTMAGIAGTAVTVLGGAMLLARRDDGRGTGPATSAARVVALRAAGLSLSAAGAVFLKRAATSGGGAWTLAAWVAVGGIVLGAVQAARGWPRGDGEGKAPALGVALHAATFLAMQALTIAVFRRTLLAYSFVFFQLGMVLQVIVGRVVFREPHFARRLAACLVMAAGAGLVLWGG